ncbi:MAG: hypothetical protein E7532_01455 [Ruminococcaceae bacterium]|nr:hypothetical protein [Oscillospiraceae bacterium]
MNKKVSLGIVVAACLLAAAIAFSAAFLISRSIFNSKLKDLSQKQEMFSRLSDIDNFVRQHYDGVIDEGKLHDAMKKAYSEALSGDVIFMTADEFKGSVYELEGCSFQLLSDGTYMVMVEGVTEGATESETTAPQ